MAFQLLAGPCVIESEEMILEIAERMKEITERAGVDYYFKASFDKANRTSIHSYRGPGLEEGLRILQKVKDTYGLKIGSQSEDLEEYEEHTTIEGLYTLHSLMQLLKRNQIKSPLVEKIYSICVKGENPEELLTILVENEGSNNE